MLVAGEEPSMKPSLQPPILQTALLLAFAVIIGLAGPMPMRAAHSTRGHSGTLLPGTESLDLMPEVVTNAYPTEFRVGSFTDALDSVVAAAVTDWNNALRSAPNSLTKFPLHCCFNDDAAGANVQVVGVPDAEIEAHCGAGAIACNEDDLIPGDASWNPFRRPLYIIVSLDRGAAVRILNHELGHSVSMLNEHYGPNFSCGYPWAVTIMDAPQCGSTTPQPHDEDDFFNLHKPQEVPNPISMTIDSGTAVTYRWSGSADVRHNVDNFYIVRKTDTNGSTIDSAYQPDYTASRQYANIGIPARWCVTVSGFSSAGFQGLNPWTPPARHGCASKFTGPNAGGPFLATTHRISTGAVRIRIRNLSGGDRYVWALGPALQNIGCSRVRVATGGTYSCDASLSVGQYSDLFLLVETTTPPVRQSYGAIDFD